MFSTSLLHSSVDHRFLHSFPTRRSSDLPNSAGRSTSATMVRDPDWLSLDFQALQKEMEGQRAREPRILVPTWDRSEEHTSELQSNSDLVCRLRLEKKKRRKSSTDCLSGD